MTKEAEDVLSFFSTGSGAFRFFALLFPGFIALAIYDLRVPSERRKWAEMGLGLVAYSILIDTFAATYLILHPLNLGQPWQLIVFTICSMLIVPALVGWFSFDLREFLATKGLILSAMPKAWDAFFYAIRKEPVALLITLKDGKKIGAFWAESPIASSFPAGEDLLIKVPIKIDDDGNFIERDPNAIGLLISRDDIVTIAAFDAKAVAAAANAASQINLASNVEAARGTVTDKNDEAIDTGANAIRISALQEGHRGTSKQAPKIPLAKPTAKSSGAGAPPPPPDPKATNEQ
jgi:hypothetical protein